MPQPPENLSRPRQALWWLAEGGYALGPDWDSAHKLCQQAEGDNAHDWVHALCHRIEGDTANAGYWYRRAGQPAASGSFADEAAAIEAALA